MCGPLALKGSPPETFDRTSASQEEVVKESTDINMQKLSSLLVDWAPTKKRIDAAEGSQQFIPIKRHLHCIICLKNMYCEL